MTSTPVNPAIHDGRYLVIERENETSSNGVTSYYNYYTLYSVFRDSYSWQVISLSSLVRIPRKGITGGAEYGVPDTITIKLTINQEGGLTHLDTWGLA